MKFLIVVLASFRLSFILPAVGNNDTTCTVPQLVALENTILKAHWRWWVVGDSVATAREDSSLAGAPGTRVDTPVYNVPMVLLKRKSWATDELGSHSCDTLAIFFPFRIRPWTPHITN